MRRDDQVTKGLISKRPVSPHSNEAEMCVLGSIMVSSKRACRDLAEMLTEESFYLPNHRLLWRCCSSLVAEGSAVDFITVKDWLIRNSFINSSGEKVSLLSQAGGLDYITNLSSLMPTAGHGPYYARIVLDYFTIRRLFEGALEVQEVACSPDFDIEEKLAKCREIIDSAATFRASSVDAATIKLDEGRRYVPIHAGVVGPRGPLHVGSLGAKVGGYPQGQITTIEAPTGIGKSWMAQQEARQKAILGYRSLYLTFADMGDQDIAYRIIGMGSGLDFRPAEPDPLDDDVSADDVKAWAIYQKAESEFRSWGNLIEFYDSGHEGNEDNVQAACSWMTRRQGADPAQCAFLDYHQMLTFKGRNDSTTDEQRKIAIYLQKFAARHDDLATVVLSQVNDDGQTQYSTQLEKVAAVRIQLKLVSDPGHPQVIKWEIKKHRFKPVRGFYGYWKRTETGLFVDAPGYQEGGK